MSVGSVASETGEDTVVAVEAVRVLLPLELALRMLALAARGISGRPRVCEPADADEDAAVLAEVARLVGEAAGGAGATRLRPPGAKDLRPEGIAPALFQPRR